MALLLAALAAPAPLTGQAPPDAPRVTFAGYVDGYFAYDFGRPATLDRAFTTQAVRHNEFNVNLMFVEAKLDGSRVRGRLALQAGTSVQSNYAGEPAIGGNSGPTLARHIQEAVAGVRLGEGLWVDGGIFYSHIGSESWASRDNPNYTRSLIAEYSPYYEAGVKLTWTASDRVTASLNVVNGWQNISENNSDKAVGVRVDFAASPTVGFSAYNFIGNEQPTGSPARTRYFQGVSLRLAPSPKSQIVATADVGVQEGAPGDDSHSWYGGSLVGRYQVGPAVSLGGRVETYRDQDQVIVVTGTPDGLQTWGGSVNLDVLTSGRALWRTEIRGLRSTHEVFPDRDAVGGLTKRNLVMVTSLALSF